MNAWTSSNPEASAMMWRDSALGCPSSYARAECQQPLANIHQDSAIECSSKRLIDRKSGKLARAIHRMHRRFYGVAAALLYSAEGCGPSLHIVEPAELNVLAEFPGEQVSVVSASADGAVFVATNTSLYRSVPAEGDHLALVSEVQDFVTELFPVSKDCTFALTRSRRVYRWHSQEGWSAFDLPPFDSLRVSSHGVRALPLYDVWARNEEDAYVVGDLATILHFNGDVWTLETNPLEAIAALPAPAVYDSRLWAVSGNAERTYAAGAHVLVETDPGWEELLVPEALGGASVITAIAALENGVYFGGARLGRPYEVPLLLRYVDGRWSGLDDEISNIGEDFFGGRAQPNGSALFWTYSGIVVEAIGESLRLYDLSSFSQFAGAAVVGDYLYAGGTAGETGRVVRARRP